MSARQKALKTAITARCDSDDDWLRAGVRSWAEGSDAFFKKHQNEIIASQVGNQYLLSSSTQLAAARASATSGNYVPLAWFVFNVDLIAGEGSISTFYEDERQGRTRRVAVALERTNGAVASLTVPGCGTFTFEYDGNELVGYGGPNSRCAPDLDGAPMPTLRPPTAKPTSEPTSTGAPTSRPTACADDPTWCYGNCSPNDCVYVAQKLARCKASHVDDRGRSPLDMCPATCGLCDPVVSIPDLDPIPIPIDPDLDLTALPPAPAGKKKKRGGSGLSLTIVLVLAAAAAIVLCCVGVAAYYSWSKKRARDDDPELGKPPSWSRASFAAEAEESEPAPSAPPSWSRASFVEESEPKPAPSGVVVLDL